MSSLSESNNNTFNSYVPNLSPQSPSNDNKSGIDLCNHLSVKEMDVNAIWKKSNFTNRQTNHKHETDVDIDPTKMSWTCDDKVEEEEVANGESFEEEESVPCPTEANRLQQVRRPMNAFLMFCKKHRPIVRKKFPGLENRGVTKILGDWWKNLDPQEKKPYTDLAKEYKTAFFQANPNFKWYKLPARPLRNVKPRPNNVREEASPPVSPTIQSAPTAEFTPGKLADESQLGMLTSLLKNNSTFNAKQQDSMCNNNNQMENNNKEYLSPVANNDISILPPKPLKKRSYECVDNKTITRKIFKSQEEETTDVNMTSYEDEEDEAKNGFKDTRKSGRKGKGNLYADFMKQAKLLKNPRRDKNPEPSNFILENTIKRLGERILPKNEAKTERTRTVSEMSETEDFNKTIPSFDLIKRISDLTSFSYDIYQQRKRECKKRKRVRSRVGSKARVETVGNGKNLVGSKKRKNKQNITHLEKERFPIGLVSTDMSGLDTLAAIAASKAKMESDGKSDAS